MPEVATPNQAEREFETASDEFFKNQSQVNAGYGNVLFANIKRTYDEYQQESLESIKRNRTIVDKLVSDAQQFDNQRQVIANQALQNAVETSNMVAKQAVRHSDIAIDNQWNPVQQGAADTMLARTMTIDDASLKAIGSVVAAAVAEALSTRK
ncbi:MAG: hypothetical protein LC130_13880 [Bryobacterales bacterium]|nr:hypothetical protein [Steroidobacteraceae bacterium]MCZ2076075.1 hypothetical protein [Bryobacterales bacterium]MEB2361875.1 hypothetical protein [Bryobacterales bacterium]